jgi:hypothetical protein
MTVEEKENGKSATQAGYVYKHRTYDAKDIYGQSATDWEKRIDMQALVEKRCERARQKMKEAGVGHCS